LRFIRSHPLFIAIALCAAGLVVYTVNTYVTRGKQAAGFGFGAAPVVLTEVVRQTTLVDSIEAIGTTLANESVSLSSKVTDTVRRVNFEDGDYVDQGDVLVELTNAEETAQLAEARATLTEAERQFKRIEDLISQNLASELQLDEVRARQETANARLEGVLARLDDRLIRAPFSGLLGYRNVSPGTLLSPSTPVTTLDDISVVKLDFSIPENYLAVVEPGQEVSAKSVAYPAIDFRGTVATVNSRVDTATRAVGVRAHIDNDERLLRPGMMLTVSLKRSASQALVVPEEAVVPMQSKEYVYLVGEGDTAQRVLIETGQRQPGLVEVTAGLSPGQEVITEGILKVRPGIKVVRKGDQNQAGGESWGAPSKSPGGPPKGPGKEGS
jgi:membrane fusion protein (multidrug efflux system)